MSTIESIEFLIPEDHDALDFCAAYISSAWSESFEEAQTRLRKYARRENNSFCLVAKIGGTPVGMMAFYQRTALQTDGVYEPWTAGLYVVTHYRNQGIGGRLLARVQEVAREKGYQKVHLGTDKEPLKRWYTRLGWRLVGKAFDTDHQYDVFKYDL
jgi:GNAT superfamily N-acetyltransferase